MRLILRVLIVIILIAADQATKYWVELSLAFQQSEPFVPFISFYRTYNEGIAFSGLSFVGNKFLIAMIIVIIGFVVWLWSQLENNRIISHFGFAFIVAGALGNLIDRFYHGHVIDFIQFHTQNWSFAIFNLADSMITIGAILIILDEILQAFQVKQETGNE